MPSFRVLKEEHANDVAFDFEPKKFPVEIPEVASDFTKEGALESTTFKLNELVSEQIGIAENEKERLEEKVDALAVEKLKEVQEQAYKEAYELGLSEGRQKAFDETNAELTDKLESLNQLISKITNLKKDLVAFNEGHIVKTLCALASKIAFREITENEETIIPVISSIMESAHTEERLKIRVSEKDFEFIARVEDELKKKIENFETIKFEKDESVNPGGCIVEGNYGVIDASIEQRVQKIWDLFAEKTPKVKDQVS